MSYKSVFVVIAAVGYITYLMVATWGAGKLALEVEEEVKYLQCRPECKLAKYRKKKLPKRCYGYCKKKK